MERQHFQEMPVGNGKLILPEHIADESQAQFMAPHETTVDVQEMRAQNLVIGQDGLGSLRNESHADKQSEIEQEKMELEEEKKSAELKRLVPQLLDPRNILDLKSDLDTKSAQRADESQLTVDATLDKDGSRAKHQNIVRGQLKSQIIDNYVQVSTKTSTLTEVPQSVKEKVAGLMELSYEELEAMVEEAAQKAATAPAEGTGTSGVETPVTPEKPYNWVDEPEHPELPQQPTEPENPEEPEDPEYPLEPEPIDTDPLATVPVDVIDVDDAGAAAETDAPDETYTSRVKSAFRRAKNKLGTFYAGIGAGFTSASLRAREYFNDEEHGAERKKRAKIIGVAAGAVAVAGVAYLAYKGMHDGGSASANETAPPQANGAETSSMSPIELQVSDERLPWTHVTDQIGSNGTPRIMELVDKGQANGWEFVGNNQSGGSGAILSVKSPDGQVLTGNGNINAALDYIAAHY